jgi:anthranilate synthase component II
MQTKVLLIDNYDSFTYNLLQIININPKYSCTILKNDKVDLNNVDEYDKILISPGPGLPLQAGIICELIKSFSSHKSILGVCLGHQAIAVTFGGQLFQLPQVQHGIKKEIKIIDGNDYLFRNLPNKIKVGLYHSWIISQASLPDCLKVTSLSNDNMIMSISHRTFDVKGIQFHPESIMTEFGNKIIYNWLEE